MSLGGRLCLSSSQGTNLTVTELNRLHGGLLNFGGGGGRRRRRQLNSFSSSNSNRSSFGGNGIGDHQCSSGGLNFLFHFGILCFFRLHIVDCNPVEDTLHFGGGSGLTHEREQEEFSGGF